MIDRTYDDPVVAEIHKNRHRILARFGNDIDAYMAFAAKRRIPGAKYVDIESGEKAEFTYPSLVSIPADTGVLCACESATINP